MYPGSIHVKNVAMQEATDTEIWEYAKQEKVYDCFQRF
ncbi:MAG: DUF5615 family PIN-like protein [Candidatus Woykebacteria bacterium]